MNKMSNRNYSGLSLRALREGRLADCAFETDVHSEGQ